MFFIDTHFHAGDYIPDMGEYCGEAAAESVSRLILCSGNFEESERAASFASENEAVYFAAGVHPHEAERMTGNFEDFKVFAAHGKFVAVGEIGLDFYYDTSGRAVQQKVFAGFWSLPCSLMSLR